MEKPDQNINKKYTVTSNNVKLLKHLDKLQNIQNHKSSPIMVHLMPTEKCNINCETCCFRGSNKQKRELNLDFIKDAMKQFYELGTRAVEITGGGDPTMYPQINELINYLNQTGYTIGINTNGVLADRIKEWDKVKWTRLSMNTLDHGKKHALEAIRKYTPSPKITACYVWNNKGEENILKIIEYANKEKITTRVVPNCIQEKELINNELNNIIKIINNYKNNKYVFASDHNVDLEERKNNKCYIHHIKPALFTDGYVYSCPSSELSVENGITLKPEFRICHASEIKEYYSNNFEIKERNCKFCKYKPQNELLEQILMETDDNEFA